MSFNLLPPEEKRRIQRIYRTNRNIIIAEAILLVLAVSLVLLLPLYFLSESLEVSSREKINVVSDDGEAVNLADIEERVTLLNKKIKALSGEKEKTAIYDLFVDITEGKDAGISITNLLYTEENLAITGVARSRETLLDFRRELEQKTYTETVDLPISNFAKDTDISFSMNVSFKTQ